jgi:hypothetical protein
MLLSKLLAMSLEIGHNAPECLGRALHVVGVGGVLASQIAQERKDVLAYDRVHLSGFKVLKPRPSQVGIRPTRWVVALGEA